MTASDRPGALESALYRIFSAVARLTLKRGLPFDAVVAVAKGSPFTSVQFLALAAQ